MEAVVHTVVDTDLAEGHTVADTAQAVVVRTADAIDQVVGRMVAGTGLAAVVHKIVDTADTPDTPASNHMP